MAGWMAGWVGGWMDGWMDGWMAGWMAGWTPCNLGDIRLGELVEVTRKVLNGGDHHSVEVRSKADDDGGLEVKVGTIVIVIVGVASGNCLSSGPI